jgi:hypothetical protein
MSGSGSGAVVLERVHDGAPQWEVGSDTGSSNLLAAHMYRCRASHRVDRTTTAAAFPTFHLFTRLLPVAHLLSFCSHTLNFSSNHTVFFIFIFLSYLVHLSVILHHFFST